MNKSRGRPRGNPPTRARIADAARPLFLDRGYRGTTVRAIAAAAQVDSALISYHFGSKQGLFAESMGFSCQSPDLAAAFEGDLAGLPGRLLRAVMALWEGAPPDGLAMRDADAMEVFREYLETELHGRLAEFLRGPGATDRATAAVAVIGGLVFTRYLNPLRPAADLPPAELERIMLPSLRAALRGPTLHRGAA